MGLEAVGTGAPICPAPNIVDAFSGQCGVGDLGVVGSNGGTLRRLFQEEGQCGLDGRQEVIVRPRRKGGRRGGRMTKYSTRIKRNNKKADNWETAEDYNIRKDFEKRQKLYSEIDYAVSVGYMSSFWAHSTGLYSGNDGRIERGLQALKEKWKSDASKISDFGSRKEGYKRLMGEYGVDREVASTIVEDIWACIKRHKERFVKELVW